MSSAEANPEIALIERGVLAAVLDDAEVAGVVAEIISPENFFEPRHEIIFRKVLDFYQEGKPLDVLNMVTSIADDGHLDMVGGYPYFMDIIDPDAIHATGDPVTYAMHVYEFARRRELSHVGTKIQESSRTGSGYQSDDIVANMQSVVQNFSERSFGNEFQRLSEFVDESFAKLEDTIVNGRDTESFVPTGFVDLDAKLGGFSDGQMIIVAGRPAAGKTTLALDFARNAAFMSDKSVLFFSLEMGSQELIYKILAAEAHVLHKKIRLGEGITDEDWAKLEDAKQKLKRANFYVDDNPILDLVALQSKCMKQKARPEGLDLVVIDYLQLMKEPPGSSPREQKISEISRNIKILAKKLGVPIIILAQLNRGNVNRTDKTPMVSDLRESGSLEQDADVVLLVHRPEVYDPNEKPGIAELIIGKARAADAGTVDIISLLEYSKFGNGAGMYRSTENPMEPPDDIPPEPEEDVFGGDFPEDDSVVVHPLDSELSPNYNVSEESVTDSDGGGTAW